MSNAQQALGMTAVLFGLTFVGIFLFWFAEKFRPHGENHPALGFAQIEVGVPTQVGTARAQWPSRRSIILDRKDASLVWQLCAGY